MENAGQKTSTALSRKVKLSSNTASSEMQESGLGLELPKDCREKQHDKPLSDDNVSLDENSTNNPLEEPSEPHGNIGVSEDPAKSAPKVVARSDPNEIHSSVNRPLSFHADGVSVSKLALSDGAEASQSESVEPRMIDPGSLAFSDEGHEDFLVNRLSQPYVNLQLIRLRWPNTCISRRQSRSNIGLCFSKQSAKTDTSALESLCFIHTHIKLSVLKSRSLKSSSPSDCFRKRRWPD